MKNFIIVLLIFFTISSIIAQEATIREEFIKMKTYPFSDPDPVARNGRIYPYFRFNQYTAQPIDKEWKMVILENKYIEVYVCPDIGGKIWGAIEKSTGKEFIYFNHVVKFRDVAMRGAWTSGGLEYNFGDIGHIPTCATPVDYRIKTNPNGSVSCVVGAIDLPSRTKWNVEIILGKDKAYFETKVSWHNNTNIPCTYYHWMNAAAKADGNLEFLYPGNKHIGHGGELGEWPVEDNKKISFYENNDFGGYKSYHIINSYSDYFGGYWHDEDFGFGHLSSYDDKPGKKIWIWGLSDQGMIWKDLLSDADGQYIEYQAGKLFNQAAYSSTFTPFKHKEFMPYDADIMSEIWFPIKNTKGMISASKYGILNLTQNDDKLLFCALQPINNVITIEQGGNQLFKKQIILKPMELFTLPLESLNDITISLGNKKLYSTQKNNIVNRPIEPNSNFNWNSAFGLYTKGLELEKQRMYNEAIEAYHKSLKIEPAFSPALNRIALNYYRRMDYTRALKYILESIAVDTYDAECNYFYGLINLKLGNTTDAKSGFSIAAASVQYRSAAFTELARILLNDKDYGEALTYINKALAFNKYNFEAYRMSAVINRKTHNEEAFKKDLKQLYELDATDNFINFELFLYGRENIEYFKSKITSELPHEIYLELAIKYYNYGYNNEAINVLKHAPVNSVISLWLAYLDSENMEKYLQEAISASPNMVFPHRHETASVLEVLNKEVNNWIIKYYIGLVYLNLGRTEEAKILFKNCGNEPDFVPFYLKRATLFNNDKEKSLSDLLFAKKLDNNNRLTNIALTKYYFATGDYVKALPIARKVQKQNPENPETGLNYAKALINMKKYKDCFNFLVKFEVLPYEGATIGRNIYYETCIRLAVSELVKEKHQSAIYYANKAKEWPENLGVGSPYDVDERMENYILAIANEKAGNDNISKQYYDLIANYQGVNDITENSKLLFQLKVLGKSNKLKEAENILDHLIKIKKNNPYLKWVKIIFNGGNDKEIIKTINDYESIILPYDTKFIDKDFKLVINVNNIIKKLK